MSFPAYESYKNSGWSWIGDIPQHWGVRRMKTLFGRVSRPVREEDKIVTAFRNGEVTLRENRREEGFTTALQEIGYQGVRAGDLVIHAMDGFAGAIGVSDSDGKSTPVYTVCTAQRDADARYYALLLRHMALSGFITSLSKGIRERSTDFRWADASVLSLPHPTLEEQRAVVAFLDRETAKIDALVEAQERLIAILKEKRQAVISHAVTKGLAPSAPMKDSGVEWLGQVPAHWEVTALKRSWSVTDCKHVTAEFVGEGVPVASIREVQARFVDLRHAKQTTDGYYALLVEGGREPAPGDLIFSRNATVGEVAEVSDQHPPFAMGQDVCLLRRQDVSASSAYLYHVIRSQVVQEQLAVAMIGSTFKRVNVEEIRNLTIPVPPPEEQVRIADHVEGLVAEAEALVRQAEVAIDLLQERRAALISAAVTGKIDVRGLVQTAEAA